MFLGFVLASKLLVALNVDPSLVPSFSNFSSRLLVCYGINGNLESISSIAAEDMFDAELISDPKDLLERFESYEDWSKLLP